MGEFDFLASIMKLSPTGDEVVVPNGDDAAVFRTGLGAGSSQVVVSTDTIVSGDHFSLEYFSPEQVGIKVVESSASDICAMGVTPNYIFLSLCAPKSVEQAVLQEVYSGVQKACERVGVALLGGDTTHGELMSISATVIGLSLIHI